MSDPSAPMDPQEREGVRTYRGRTIEELIPRIRAELGPDAIILREREGLTGGIGGFFAQRCVEIDARAAPRLSIYDDEDDFAEAEEGFGDEDGFDDEDGFGDEAEAYEYEAAEYQTGEREGDEHAWAQDADQPALPTLQSAFSPPEPPVPPALPSPEPAVAPPEPTSPPALAPPASAPFLDEASFAARLEEATLASEPAVEPAPAEAPEPARSPVTPTFIAFDELEPEPDEPEPEPLAVEPEPDEPEPEPLAVEPEPDEPEPERLAAEPEPVAREVEPLAPAPWLTFAQQELTPPAPTPPFQAPPATAAPAPTMPGPAISVSAPPAADHAQAPSQPAAPPRAAGPYGYGVRRRGGLLPAAERMLRAALDVASAANERRELEQRARLAAGSAPPPAAPSVAPSEPVEQAQPAPRDAELEHRLVAAGLSASRAASLVGAAVSKRGPFSAGGELVDDVRAAIAAALPAPQGLPAQRGAVAVVGAGGSGKTRCVAAMAVARARAGGLVSVASLGAPGQESELGALLHGEPVNVIPAMRTRATARAVASARDRGLVIIDTAAVTPHDGSTIDVIAEALRSFELDGIYLAVPATLSLGAGARLIDGFSAFDLVGLVATHADETDQLGVIAELSMLSGIGLAATHTGLDLQNAIAPADPGRVASQLLP